MFALITKIIEDVLVSLNVQPSSYGFMFPPEIEQEKIAEMINDKVFPTLAGLAPALTYAILLSLARYVLHIFVFKPLAKRSMKIKEIPFEPIKEIEKALPVTKKSIENSKVKAFCAESGRNEADVNRYLWLRKRHLTVQRKIVKYVEAFWRAIFYLSFCVLGYNALFVPETASWIRDTKNHWIDWPLHPMSAAISFYYQIELGCYIHQLFWTEVTRSDALEMILHHFITILLIVLSYLTNYTRIGASILLVHDCSDVFLEVGKLFNYMSKVPEYKWFAQRICDSFFAVFAISFFVSRLVLYPRYMVYSQVVESPAIFGGIWPGYWYFAVLLLSLQGLHVFWFYLIFKMIFRLLSTGIDKDVRSDDEDESLTEQEAKTD